MPERIQHVGADHGPALVSAFLFGFGDRVANLEMRRQEVTIDHSPSPLEFREYWKRNYGPTVSAYKYNAENPERVADLDRDFLAFLTEWNTASEPGRTAYHAEYLLVTGTKRGG